MIITELKQGVKNPNRVNVFVDSKYAFSLDVVQVVDYKLKVGREITGDELAELKKASEFGKLYQRALEKALTRPHSEREMRDYLFRKLKNSSSDTLKAVRPSLRSSEEFSEFSDAILQRLISKGYVNDRRFAEFWVENRFVKKGVSKKRLSMELMKKGVARDIIDEVLDGRNDEEEILKIIAKKRNKYDDEKLISYLVRQGFSYQLAQSQVREYGKD
ncbi:RecX family transcriptional regulator [Candidatus Saccharibacteria bacterium]|nr:RecX family transcriptional regulator [Candidatus Saccharibacteria bacterium]